MRVPARLDNLHRLIELVVDSAHKTGLKEKRVSEIEIAVEEALVNIFHYAYPDSEGDVEISCKSEPGKSFVIEIVDEGIPFDPMSAQEPDTTLDIDARKIGGIGIFLVKKLMDDVRYRREGGKNILELTVFITAAGGNGTVFRT